MLFRNYLIKKEGIDWYDKDINYNPFIWGHCVNVKSEVANNDYIKT
ncbi:hypothetical protein RICGR_0018 [Rickettsiella grylli]|uniref:Uncharacterized protein n=2 Tax=Rickettsiella grylli TaxID=59196 RepID=A8PK36_9COXI|nr:hypothetical protein RICGR_0018 [Rickettsiella grylli]